MTEDDLRALIAEVRRTKSELDAVEVKRAKGGTPKVHDSLSALANRTSGGTILFGIDEQQGFALCGVHNLHLLQEQLGNQAANEMAPPIRPVFTHVEVEGKIVVAMEIPEAPYNQKPCYKKTDGWQNGAYIRTGSGDRRMTPYEIYGYLSAQDVPRDDCQPVLNATVDDLDLPHVAAYFQRQQGIRPRAAYLGATYEQLLEWFRLAVPVDGVLRPTLAGLLVFGEEPDRFERQLVITFLQYYGTSEEEKTPRGERFMNNRKFIGPIPNMVEDAVKHLLANIRIGSRIGTVFREDVPEYPEEAIREAIINAVAHRDYSAYARGSYIQIRLFADRLEIQSPGGLYGNVTEETLDRNQSTRNSELMHLLEDLGIVENRGSGIRTMITAMRAARLEPPRFVDDRTAFLVTFFNVSFMDPETVRWLERFSERDLTAEQRYALAYLRHHQTITNAEYQTLNRVNYTTAYRDLRDLTAADLVTIVGSGSSASYVLNVPTDVPTKPVPIPVDQPPREPAEKIIAFVRANGSITNEQSRRLLGVGDRRALQILHDMFEQGLLIRTGTGRWTKYALP